MPRNQANVVLALHVHLDVLEVDTLAQACNRAIRWAKKQIDTVSPHLIFTSSYYVNDVNVILHPIFQFVPLLSLFLLLRMKSIPSLLHVV